MNAIIKKVNIGLLALICCLYAFRAGEAGKESAPCITREQRAVVNALYDAGERDRAEEVWFNYLESAGRLLPEAETVTVEPAAEAQAMAGSGAAGAMDGEAEILARMLYGQCRWNSADAQRAVCWCALNRVDDSRYPDTVEGVVTQPSQWMGWSEDNELTEELYAIALEVLEQWRSGGMRPVSSEFCFMDWSYDGVELRTTFEEKGSTRYWMVA